MKLILLGAPGSGKGTQATLIAERYNIPHVSTGDILRDCIKSGTELGLKIKAIIDGGDLAPDELIVEIVKERIQKEDCQNGYLLDGFPRNLAQAKILDKFDKPNLVLNVSLPIDKIEKRLTGRRTCDTCKNSFHVDVIGEIKTCPKCGGELYVRDDDNVESVYERLFVYKTQTEPLIKYYENQGNLAHVNGDNEINKVFEEIKRVIDDNL